MASLATIRAGDIVKVDKKGRVFHAIVDEKPGGQLKGLLAIEPLETGITWRSAKSREIVGHWRLTKNGQRTTGQAAD